MLTLRRATSHDIPAMVEVVNAAFQAEPFRTRPRTSVEGLTGAMTRNVFFVAELDGRIAGVILTRVEDRTGYSGMLAVDPARQRTGLGRALLAAAEDFCRASGCTEATLSTGDFNLGLVTYYGRLGYRETHREPAPPDAPFSRSFLIIHMAKPL